MPWLLLLLLGGLACSEPRAEASGQAALAPDASKNLRRTLAESQERRPGDRGFQPSAPGLFAIDVFDRHDGFRRNLARAAASEQTGRTGVRMHKIWNGEPSDHGFVVALFGREGRCSGVLVSSTTVLTAAHCICEFRDSGVQPDGIRVALGRNPAPEALGDVIPVSRAEREIVCPFVYQEPDVVLLRLERSAQASPKRLAGASVMSALAASAVVRVVGYGLTESGRFAGRRQADVIVASPNCLSTDAAYFGCIQGRELVARNVNQERDACNGDSGGALLLEHPEDSGQFHLVSVVSRPVLRGAACGDGGVYGRVDDALRRRVETFATAHAR